MEIIDILLEAKKIVKERQKLEKGALERKQMADLFNGRYKYNKDYYKDSFAVPNWQFPCKNAWMCEKCNAIHKPIGYDPFGGLTYPRCCGD